MLYREKTNKKTYDKTLSIRGGGGGSQKGTVKKRTLLQASFFDVVVVVVVRHVVVVTDVVRTLGTNLITQNQRQR